MPPIRSILNQPINLEAYNALYRHASAAGVVHGLPSGASVLGDKSGTHRFISTSTGTGPTGSYTATYGFNGVGTTHSYTVAYASTPILLASGGNANEGTQITGGIEVGGKSSTTFKASCLGRSGYTASCPFDWCAIGT